MLQMVRVSLKTKTMATVTPPRVAESHRVAPATNVRIESKQDQHCFSASRRVRFTVRSCEYKTGLSEKRKLQTPLTRKLLFLNCFSLNK